jgi:hypothetical protein
VVAMGEPPGRRCARGARDRRRVASRGKRGRRG